MTLQLEDLIWIKLLIVDLPTEHQIVEVDFQIHLLQQIKILQLTLCNRLFLICTNNNQAE